LVIDSVQEKKAVEVTVLDVRDLTSFTDYFVICNGNSEPQIKSLSRHLEEKMSGMGLRPHHVEGKPESGWILLDYDDFVVHIFSPEKRNFYDLERLWGDAPRMEVRDGVPAQVVH